MAQLIDRVSARFTTDYAIVQGQQDAALDYANAVSGGYAGSSVGLIVACAGHRWSEIELTVERWDARPSVNGFWEDGDELPFAAIDDGGALILGGFENGPVGLDVDGLDDGRVLVMSRGRRHSENQDTMPGRPEHWLFQLFPNDRGSDVLAGPPRRLGETRHLPGPDVLPRWEDVPLSAIEESIDLFRALDRDFRPVGEDIENIVRWAGPDGLDADIERLARRLAIGEGHVVRAIELLQCKRSVIAVWQDSAGRPDGGLHVRLRSRG